MNNALQVLGVAWATGFAIGSLVAGIRRAIGT